MDEYLIHTKGEAAETYRVEAESEEDAQIMFERGDVTEPIHSEVTSAEVVLIEKTEEE